MQRGAENAMLGTGARCMQGTSRPSSTFLVPALTKVFHETGSDPLCSFT
jgi:hypothetical protein